MLGVGALSMLGACGGSKKSPKSGAGDISAVVTPAPSPTATASPAATPGTPAAPASDATPGAGSTPAPGPSPVSSASLSVQQSSRFLAQATNGPTKQEIAQLAGSDIDTWLTGQFAMLREQSHWSWMKARGFDEDQANANPKAGNKSVAGWDRSIWRQLITAPDQLRQRVGLALLDIMVVSVDALDMRWPQFAMAAYMDQLLDHAFGNFRALLGAVTTSSAMGQFLTVLGSRKANGKGSLPDENYAREMLQLFTLGLYELNQDGTLKAGPGGLPIETYTQDDISQLAQVFTGFELASSDLQTPDPLREPLVINPDRNETGTASFLGWTVSGGGMAAVDAALDVVFNHPNVPPFVSKALIQRLVTSNPSPGYVERVANTFADSGAGERGDLRAVVYAILVDPEARSDLALAAPHAGKLRDPVQRMTHWARAFSVTSKSGGWYVGNMSARLGQAPGRSPSVFNFFRPGYVPPNSELAMRGLVAPEFQIINEQSIVSYINAMQLMIKKGIDNGHGDMVPDYSPLLEIAADSQRLTEEVNLVLAAGQLSATSLSLIRAAVESFDSKPGNGADNRVRTAIMLTMASPEYLVLK